MIIDAKLDFWIKHGFNVLFVGKHGVGKTAIIKAAFDRAGLRWRYFSASTMDPWVDFIGVPRVAKRQDGSEYLELVRPKEFQDDEIEALVFDEFNRSHKKIRNAVMELIQFRSINGKRFKNLRLVWAAINPDDDERYDVESLDPAQEDRFHIKVVVPYKCNKVYFTEHYGRDNASAAIGWWNELPPEQKQLVSPRRLDYALMVHEANGDIVDVLPASSNVGKLKTALRVGPISGVLREYEKNSDRSMASRFLRSENNYAAAITYILKSSKYMDFFLPLLEKEKISSLVAEDEKVLHHVTRHCGDHNIFAEIVRSLLNVSRNKKLIKTITTDLENVPQDKLPADLRDMSNTGSGFAKPLYGTFATSSAGTWSNVLNRLSKAKQDQQYYRHRIFKEITDSIPPTLSYDDAIATLKVLNELCKRSYPDTLRQWKRLPNVVNHCIAQLRVNLSDKGITTASSQDSQLRGTAANVYGDIKAKLDKIGKGNRVDLP